MDIRQHERTQVVRPVAPPVDLDTGRLDIKRASAAAGFVLGALVVASVGGWLVVASSSGYERNWFGVFLGGGIACVALALGGVVLYVSLTESLDYRARVRDWHEQALWERQQSGGNETIEHVSEWELSTSNPAHVILAAINIQMRIAAGESIPWSTRKVRGPLFFAGRRVGDISKLTAESMGRQFGLLGLVEGRSEGDAGQWVPQDTDELIQLVVKNWRER